MSATMTSPGPDRTAASASDLTKACISRLERSFAFHSLGAEVAMENRLADLRLWADGVGAMAEGNASLEWRFRNKLEDLLMVKTVLVMLYDFLDDYANLAETGQPTEDAARCVDLAIEDLALIGVAIRRTGKASRHRRVDTSFNPEEYVELRRHLECIVLLRPSKAGLPDQLNSSSLSTIQKRLIDANLMRRHRVVVAQKRSRRSKRTDRLVIGGPDEAVQSQEQSEAASSESGLLPLKPKQRRKRRGPLTKSGFTAASTAEGSLQYDPRTKFRPGVARTQITALRSNADFPRPPPVSPDRLICKCPCCCQSIGVEEMIEVKKWRQHIIEDLCPYTCIVEDCPTPHRLFGTRQEWDTHVKADHKSFWNCPLCEEHEPIFQEEEEVVHHFNTHHPEAVQNLTLSELLFLSKTQIMGIDSCPLCSSYGREDSPEIIEHVLEHVFEFSLRALPWTKPVAHDLAKPIGTYVLPDGEYMADKLPQWITEAFSGSSSQLQLSSFDAADHSEELQADTADEDYYVPDDYYFDDASADDSSRPQAALTEPSTDFPGPELGGEDVPTEPPPGDTVVDNTALGHGYVHEAPEVDEQANDVERVITAEPDVPEASQENVSVAATKGKQTGADAHEQSEESSSAYKDRKNIWHRAHYGNPDFHPEEWKPKDEVRDKSKYEDTSKSTGTPHQVVGQTPSDVSEKEAANELNETSKSGIPVEAPKKSIFDRFSRKSSPSNVANEPSSPAPDDIAKPLNTSPASHLGVSTPVGQQPSSQDVGKKPLSSPAAIGAAGSAAKEAEAASQPTQRFRLNPEVQGGHEHVLKSAPQGKKLSEIWKGVVGKWRGGDNDLSLLSSWVDGLKQAKPEAVDQKGSPNATPSLVEKYGKPQETIGRGAFSTIKVSHKRTGGVEGLFAIKEFLRRPEESEKKYFKRLTAEFTIASSLRHPNIIHTLDLLQDAKGDYCEVMEFCTGGDLYTLILASGKLEVHEADCFFKQLVRGVEYLHEMGVTHRDLKPENLLLTASGAVKITDFGTSECFRMAWEQENHMVSGVCGSAPYIPPEEYTEKEFDPRPVDVWACGLIYMAMRTGRHLWRTAKKNEDEYYDRYLQDRKTEDGYAPFESLHRARCRNLIYSILDPNPSRRVTAAQILKSEWIREVKLCLAGEEGI